MPGRRAQLEWNMVGVVVLAVAALSARSPAFGGFGLDSLIEIGASLVVVWQLKGGSGVAAHRLEQFALTLIGSSFVLLATYLVVQSTYTLSTGAVPRPRRVASCAPRPPGR